MHTGKLEISKYSWMRDCVPNPMILRNSVPPRAIKWSAWHQRADINEYSSCDITFPVASSTGLAILTWGSDSSKISHYNDVIMGVSRVSNHQPHGCVLNRLFRRRSKKTSKLRVAGLCVGNWPGTGEFPAQMASNAENVSIWWRHYAAALAHLKQRKQYSNDVALMYVPATCGVLRMQCQMRVFIFKV